MTANCRLQSLIGTAGWPSTVMPGSTSLVTPALAPMIGVVADGDVADDAGLAGHGHVPADGDRAGHAHLGDEQAVLADLGAVADGDQVAELRAAADDRAAERRPVDGAVGPDLDVVADDHVADLRDLDPLLLDRGVAQAVLADDRAGVDGHAVAQDAVLVDDHVGEQRDVVADPAVPRAMYTPGIDRGVVADATFSSMWTPGAMLAFSPMTALGGDVGLSRDGPTAGACGSRAAGRWRR